MTLQPSPPPASASWRVLVAFRLLLLPLEDTSENVLTTAEKLESWYHVLSGETEIISEENERGVKELIRKICLELKSGVEKGLEMCQAVETEWEEIAGGEVKKSCLNMVRGIWINELEIVEAVLDEL